MNKLEEQIQNLILGSLDVKGAADKASEKILNSEEFYTRLEQRLLNEQGYRDSFVHMIYVKIVDTLASRYVEANGAGILQKLDIQAVINGMMFKAIQVGTANLKT